MLQQEFINYRNYTNRRLQRIEEKIDYFTCGMNELLIQRGLNNENFTASTNEEDDVQWRRRNNCEENEDRKELEHLKLVFPLFTESDDIKNWVQDCDEANYDGTPIYDDYVEAPVYDCPLTFDATPQDEGEQVENEGESSYNNPPILDEEPKWEDDLDNDDDPIYGGTPTFDVYPICAQNEGQQYKGVPIFDDTVKVHNISAQTVQQEYFVRQQTWAMKGQENNIPIMLQQWTGLQNILPNKQPIFDEDPEVEQGFMKEKKVLALPEQQQEISLVKKLSKQPHMLQTWLENAKILAPQCPKLYAEILDKMGCSQVFVALPNQSQNEWFASLEPWRDKNGIHFQKLSIGSSIARNLKKAAEDYDKFKRTTKGIQEQFMKLLNIQNSEKPSGLIICETPQLVEGLKNDNKRKRKLLKPMSIFQTSKQEKSCEPLEPKINNLYLNPYTSPLPCNLLQKQTPNTAPSITSITFTKLHNRPLPKTNPKLTFVNLQKPILGVHIQCLEADENGQLLQQDYFNGEEVCKNVNQDKAYLPMIVTQKLQRRRQGFFAASGNIANLVVMMEISKNQWWLYLKERKYKKIKGIIKKELHQVFSLVDKKKTDQETILNFCKLLKFSFDPGGPKKGRVQATMIVKMDASEKIPIDFPIHEDMNVLKEEGMSGQG